jgi:hypothetical protein
MKISLFPSAFFNAKGIDWYSVHMPWHKLYYVKDIRSLWCVVLLVQGKLIKPAFEKGASWHS